MEMVSFNPDMTHLTVNAEGQYDLQTRFHDGECAVQLKNLPASTWEGRNVSLITIKDMVIYDGQDVATLLKLIELGVTLDLSGVFVMRKAETIACLAISSVDDNIVGRGSKIKLPFDVTTGLPTPLEQACQRIGFSVTQ